MATRRRQSLKRAITKAAARVMVYRFTNDLIDKLIDRLAEFFKKNEEIVVKKIKP